MEKNIESMKTKLITLLLLISISSFAQIKPMKIEVDSLVFEIKRKIEIDGHIVNHPVYFKATLEGIEIYDDKKRQYVKRKCQNEKCDIIHLQPKLIITSNIIYNPSWTGKMAN